MRPILLLIVLVQLKCYAQHPNSFGSNYGQGRDGSMQPYQMMPPHQPNMGYPGGMPQNPFGGMQQMVPYNDYANSQNALRPPMPMFNNGAPQQAFPRPNLVYLPPSQPNGPYRAQIKLPENIDGYQLVHSGAPAETDFNQGPNSQLNRQQMPQNQIPIPSRQHDYQMAPNYHDKSPFMQYSPLPGEDKNQVQLPQNFNEQNQFQVPDNFNGNAPPFYPQSSRENIYQQPQGNYPLPAENKDQLQLPQNINEQNQLQVPDNFNGNAPPLCTESSPENIYQQPQRNYPLPVENKEQLQTLQNFNEKNQLQVPDNFNGNAPPLYTASSPENIHQQPQRNHPSEPSPIPQPNIYPFDGKYSSDFTSVPHFPQNIQQNASRNTLQHFTNDVSQYDSNENPQYGPKEVQQCDGVEVPQCGAKEVPQYGPREVPQYDPREVPQYGPQVVPQNSAQDVPQYGLQAVPQYGQQGVPHYGPQNVPQYGPQNVPQYSPREASQNIPQYPSQDVPQYIPKEISQNRPKEVPQYGPRELPQYIPKEILENGPREVPQSAPQNFPQEIPQYSQKEIPQFGPKEVPKTIPKEIPECGLKEVPKYTPQDVPQYVPQEAPQYVPQGVPRYTPMEVPQHVPRDGSQYIPKGVPQNVPRDGLYQPPNLDGDSHRFIPSHISQSVPSFAPRYDTLQNRQYPLKRSTTYEPQQNQEESEDVEDADTTASIPPYENYQNAQESKESESDIHHQSQQNSRRVNKEGYQVINEVAQSQRGTYSYRSQLQDGQIDEEGYQIVNEGPVEHFVSVGHPSTEVITQQLPQGTSSRSANIQMYQNSMSRISTNYKNKENIQLNNGQHQQQANANKQQQPEIPEYLPKLQEFSNKMPFPDADVTKGIPRYRRLDASEHRRE